MVTMEDYGLTFGIIHIIFCDIPQSCGELLLHHDGEYWEISYIVIYVTLFF